MKALLEICCFSIHSVINASHAGANRVEICSDRLSGGVTPSYGFIEQAVKLHKCVHVIIRPRAGDFFYSDAELEIMKRDIAVCKTLGVKGVVFGLLNKNRSVDVPNTRILAEAAVAIDVTFHRAIDMSHDLFHALDDIHLCGISRVLTSGGCNTAIEGIDFIKQMIQYSNGRINIMAGGGVNATNIKLLFNAGVREFHSSASTYEPSAIKYPDKKLKAGKELFCDEPVAGYEKITEMKNLLMSFT